LDIGSVYWVRVYWLVLSDLLVIEVNAVDVVNRELLQLEFSFLVDFILEFVGAEATL
jgi:hypothetical protein